MSKKKKKCSNRLCLNGYVYSGWGSKKKKCRRCGGTGFAS